jgi:hypothetical protein
VTELTHISELAANRYLLGECNTRERALLDGHLAQCSLCAAYLDSLRAFDAKLPTGRWLQVVSGGVDEARGLSAVAVIEPEAPGDGLGAPVEAGPPSRDSSRAPLVPPARSPSHRRGGRLGRARVRWATASAALVAAAAVALLIWNRVPVEDELLRKGSDFALEAFAKGADKPREVGDGDVVHPGERLGFRVRSQEPGFVLIAGVDDLGHAYPCHPPSGLAAPWEPSTTAVVVEGAVELDDAIGAERIVALWCPDRFAFEDIVTTLKAGARAELPLLRAGCAQREIVLEKQVRVSP